MVTEKKKQQERDENQFPSPEIKQKKKRLATVLAISNTSERIYRRERKSRREEDRKQRVKGTKSKEEGNDPKSFIAFLLLCAQVSQLSFFSSLPHFVSSIALREGKLLPSHSAWRHPTSASCLVWPSRVTGFGQ
jgi:hypothetical protein